MGYVKRSGLAGHRFDTWGQMEGHLDWWNREIADLRIHESWEDCLQALNGARLFALSTRGSTRHDKVQYREGDAFVFGPETKGLPQAMLDTLPAEQRIRVPLVPGNRSLNLSNTVALVVYEAWRQLGYPGGV